MWKERPAETDAVLRLYAMILVAGLLKLWIRMQLLPGYSGCSFYYFHGKKLRKTMPGLFDSNMELCVTASAAESISYFRLFATGNGWYSWCKNVEC